MSQQTGRHDDNDVGPQTFLQTEAIKSGKDVIAPGEIAYESSSAATKKGIARLLGKRLFDTFGAILLAILAAPAIFTIAIIIRLSGSPVIFGHERIGKGHKTFSCYKFRTMIPDAESVLQELLVANPKARLEWEENHKLRNDPRITRFGDFLRKSSLDELPQLWNVIKGEMSLVGPRPIVTDELKRYGRKAQVYCSIKPGITGLWQISGRSNVTYSRRVSLDTLYIRNQRLVLDLWIIFCTVRVVARRVGAH